MSGFSLNCRKIAISDGLSFRAGDEQFDGRGKLQRRETRCCANPQCAVFKFYLAVEITPNVAAGELRELSPLQLDRGKVLNRQPGCSRAVAAREQALQKPRAESIRSGGRPVKHCHPAQPSLRAVVAHTAESKSATLVTEHANRRVAVAQLISDNATPTIAPK